MNNLLVLPTRELADAVRDEALQSGLHGSVTSMGFEGYAATYRSQKPLFALDTASGLSIVIPAMSDNQQWDVIGMAASMGKVPHIIAHADVVIPAFANWIPLTRYGTERELRQLVTGAKSAVIESPQNLNRGELATAPAITALALGNGLDDEDFPYYVWRGIAAAKGYPKVSTATEDIILKALAPELQMGHILDAVKHSYPLFLNVSNGVPPVNHFLNGLYFALITGSGRSLPLHRYFRDTAGLYDLATGWGVTQFISYTDLESSVKRKVGNDPALSDSIHLNV